MNLSSIPGLAAPVPPAAGPAAMVGQRPHMDYAQLPEQSMHELAVWSTAGGGGATPKPVTLTVKGADDLLHWDEPFSLKRKYGYFEIVDGQATNAPMSIKVAYDDGSTKAREPADLEYTLATPDGGTEPLTLGQELQQAWGGRRQLTASYTEDGTTVSTQLAVMIGEPVTDSMKLRFKIGVEIPEAARKDVVPELEANRLISRASSSFNDKLLYEIDGDILTIEPTADCFDDEGLLQQSWLMASSYSSSQFQNLLRTHSVSPDTALCQGDPTSPSYYITEVLSDPDYAWVAPPQANVAPFRFGEFMGWSNLEYGLVEENRTVTGTSGYTSYRASQYHSCTRLKGFKNAAGAVVTRPEEGLAQQLYSGYRIYYRDSQFKYCYSLTRALVEHSPDGNSFDGFRGYQYAYCTSLTEAADEDPIKYYGIYNISNYRSDQYAGCTALTTSKPEHTLDMSGTIDSEWAAQHGFRAGQYAGCTALKPNGVEKMIEKLTGTSGSGMTRDLKYDLTGVTDEHPFYYQDDGTGEPTPAHQRDTYSPSTGQYVHQYTMYGGHATTAWKLEASTDSAWKSTYQAGETFTLDGLTVDVYTNDGKIKAYNGSQIASSPLFRVTPQPNTVVSTTGERSVTISYQAYTSDPVVSTSLPITVTPASATPEA